VDGQASPLLPQQTPPPLALSRNGKDYPELDAAMMKIMNLQKQLYVLHDNSMTKRNSMSYTLAYQVYATGQFTPDIIRRLEKIRKGIQQDIVYAQTTNVLLDAAKKRQDERKSDTLR